MSPPKRHFDVVFQLFAESHDAEPLCILSAGGRGDGLLRVEVFDGFDDAFFRLLREEAAGLAVFDGFEGAAFAVGDDGCAAGLGLDGGDAEVFFSGEYEGFGVLHFVPEHLKGLVAHHRDVGARDGFGLLKVGAVADDDEVTLRHLVKGLDDEFDFLVGDEARGGQVVVLLVLAAGECCDVDGRVDDVSLAAVDFLDATRDESAVGDEVVDAVRGARVPDAHVVQDELGERALCPVVEAGLAQVLVREVPGVADGAVDVGDVELVRPGEDAFRDAVGARDNEVVARDVELLDGERHEGQIAAVVFPRAGELLEEARMRLLVFDETALSLGQEVDEGEDVGVREDVQDLLDDALGAGVDDEPVTDDSYFHESTSFPVMCLRNIPARRVDLTLRGSWYRGCLTPRACT